MHVAVLQNQDVIQGKFGKVIVSFLYAISHVRTMNLKQLENDTKMF